MERKARTRLGSMLAGVIAAALTVTAPALTAPATASPATGLVATDSVPDVGEDDYVNMGDSFSAGSGILPLATGISPLCTQSSRNWGHVLAAANGLSLTDVSCGGASTKHFYESQFPGVAPQLDALSADTDLVTLSMGGNDNSTFANAIVKCGSAALVTAGFGNPCERWYGDRFENQVRTITYPALVKGLNAIKAAAPGAEIAITGYPWLLPPTTGCYPKMPVARGDVPYLRSLQATLNGVVEQAARDTGVTFIDVAQVSEGKDACAPVDVRWVEPLLGTLQYVPIHPNARGEAAMARQAALVLDLNSPASN